MTEDQFEAGRGVTVPRSDGRLARILRVAVYAAVLAIVVGGVYFATRDEGDATPMAAGHDHGAAPAGAGRGQPVVLSQADARRIGVTYATVQLGPLSREVRTVGQVTFDETRVQTISPKIDGWVEQLFVNATGQLVTAGEPLLTIYSPMLVTAQEELLLAKRLQSDVSGANDDARKNATDLLASARRRLSYWDIPTSEIDEIERSAQVRKTLTLRATASGYVLQKNVLAGQKIMAGDALYKVADLRVVWAEGEVFEQDLSSVHIGQTVRAEFEALPGEHRAGRISFVYPTLDPNTRTVRVRVVLPNADVRLKPGMYATIRILGTGRANVLTVPRSAVLATGERAIVFVLEEGGALVPHEVELGVSNDDRAQILRGLSAGQTVVASATFLVDAESNLGAALGGMGDMPGMQMTTPPRPLDAKAAAPKATSEPTPKKAPMADMPGMEGMEGMEDAKETKDTNDMKGMDHSAHAAHKSP